MRRRLLNLASAVSLLLCVATAVLWVRSYWIADECISGYVVKANYQPFALPPTVSPELVKLFLEETAQDTDFYVTGHCAQGDLAVYWGEIVQNRKSQPATAWFHGSSGKPYSWTRIHPEATVLGFGRTRSPDGVYPMVVAPLWGFVALFSVLPALWAVVPLRRRRKVPSGCPSCGYNLTGNTSGVCPECGTAVSSRKA